MRKLLLTLFMCWTAQVWAAPISFTSTLFQTSAVAVAGAAVDFDSDSNPPTIPLPVSSNAGAHEGAEVATAGAIATTGLLTTSADLSSLSGSANAFATAAFFGNFTASGGVIELLLDLTAASFDTVSASSFNDAALHLTSNGTLLLNEVFFFSGSFQRSVTLAAGAPSVLELVLASNADANATTGGSATGGTASTFAYLTFSAQESSLAVPEPGSLALFGIALGALCLRRRPEKTVK